MAQNALRAVPEAPPHALLEAVKGGDVLEMLIAQRQLIAEALTTAADNTRPQFNNELNKLHALIREEQARRELDEEVPRRAGAGTRQQFDPRSI